MNENEQLSNPQPSAEPQTGLDKIFARYFGKKSGNPAE